MIRWLKKRWLMIAISLIAAIIVIILVKIGVNWITAVITGGSIVGGGGFVGKFAGKKVKKIIKEKNEIIKNGKEKHNKLDEELNNEAERIKDLNPNDLLDDFNATYSRRKKNGSG